MSMHKLRIHSREQTFSSDFVTDCRPKSND